MSLNNFSIRRLSEKLRNFNIYEDSRGSSILKALPFFSDLDEPALNEVSGAILISEFSKNEIICRRGIFDKRFHLIVSGEARAVVPTEYDSEYELFTLMPGEFFGEEIVFSREPRDSTIMAVRDTMTLSMPKNIIEKCIAGSDRIRDLMNRKYIDRKLRVDLRRVPVFTPINDSLFNEILGEIELQTLPEGTVIFREGDEGDAFYLIRSGKINVRKDVNGQSSLLSILSDGQFFGETSLLLQKKRNATVEVSSAAELVKISRSDFMGIVGKDERLMEEFQEIIREREKNRCDVLENPNVAVATRKRLDINNDLNRHLDIIGHCKVDTDHGSALLASLPGARYPYVYPRDSACASRFLYKLAVSSLKSGDFAFDLLSDIARFILNCQREDGHWGQRYDIEGNDNSIYIQEDNVAHGVIILCRYLLAAKHKEKNIPDTEKIIDAIARGSAYATMNYYRHEILFFYSTTSIHESAIEEGYSLWVNFAYLLMLRLIDRIAAEYDVKKRFAKEIALKDVLESNIYNIFTINGRFVRRLKPHGDVDLRPDITLMSPFYFSTGMDYDYFKNTEYFVNSIKFIEQALWDPELGLLQRYLHFIEDPDTHAHAGNGPWMQYSSILAQYYFYIEKPEKGNNILSMINRYASPEGHLCEHLTTPDRFHEFMKREWMPGKDADKELFTRNIMHPHIPYDFIIKELNHMIKAYNEIDRMCKEGPERGYIIFEAPLMWSHVEYAMALLFRAEKELKNLDSNIVI